MQARAELHCPYNRHESCHSLPEVLHAVPRLLELMPPEAKQALTVTSKSLQKQICASATSIRLISLSGLECLFKLGMASHLRSLTLSGLKLQLRHTHSLAAANLPCLISLNLSRTCLQTAPTAMLAAAKWPLLTEVDISYNGLLPGTCKAIASLSWPRLTNVNLSGNWLDVITFPPLTRAKWPMLKCLELKDNPDLCLMALSHLSMADWPCLLELTLAGSFTLESFVALMKDRCPFLRKLHIECAHTDLYDLNIMSAFPELQELQIISSSHFVELGDVEFKRLTRRAQWSKLQVLKLQASNVSADLLLESSAADWPELHTLSLKGFDWEFVPLVLPDACVSFWLQLSSLTLSHSRHIANMIQWLCLAEWPKLEHLDLSHNRHGRTWDALFGCTAPQWPELQTLDLSCNSLRDQDVLDLVNCHADDSWSKLKSLHLQSHSSPMLKVDTVTMLLSGKWPKLERLQLSVCSANIAATAAACGASAAVCPSGQPGWHLIEVNNLTACQSCPCMKSILLYEGTPEITDQDEDEDLEAFD